MTKRLCRCGCIVEAKCPKCDQPDSGQKTAERGYDNKWKTLSERWRQQNPVCHVCQWLYENYGRLPIQPARQVHHIVKVADDKTQRLNPDNLLSVCQECHDWIEDKPTQAKAIKEWLNAGDGRSERW